MEFSSPLAAMQPPLCPPQWGFRPDMNASRSLFNSNRNTFNLNNMNRKKLGTDYFALKPVRGSSPTVSLAADLSQNFHIDQSPQVATPRRALFTSNFLQMCGPKDATATPSIALEGVTTPPIPLSSPGFGSEMDLDCSPLPHKARCISSVDSIMMASPISPTVSDEDMFSLCSTPSQIPPEMFKPSALVERRKAGPLRPQLSRIKHFSTSSVSLSSKEKSHLPAFRSGPVSSGLSNSSTLSLDDCFAVSPGSERSTPSFTSAARPRQPFPISTNMGRSNGLPWSAPVVRKPAGPPSKRPTKFRRSMSMYEHPNDIMGQTSENVPPSPLQAVSDVPESPKLRVPHSLPDKPDSLPRITNDTLVQILDGELNHMYDQIKIIDCRFEYEFNGGHVEQALNYSDKEILCEDLFKSNTPPNTLLVFHCEFSAHRAPLMAQSIRSRDREINADCYPKLHYPEIYILEGGYSSFYESYKTRCNPQDYLRMDAKNYENACEQGMNKLRYRTKLNRAKTFAFGQQSSQMEDSPTAHSRSKTGTLTSFDMMSDVNFNLQNIGRLGTTRRTASY